MCQKTAKLIYIWAFLVAMTDQAENTEIKRQMYENCVLRDSEALVVNYLRHYRREWLSII